MGTNATATQRERTLRRNPDASTLRSQLEKSTLSISRQASNTSKQIRRREASRRERGWARSELKFITLYRNSQNFSL